MVKRNGQIDVVAVYCVDRLSRDPTHGVILTQEFEKLSNLDFEAKRMALDMLDIKVWVDGYNVEVTGVIPISDYVIVTPQSRLDRRNNIQFLPFRVHV